MEEGYFNSEIGKIHYFHRKGEYVTIFIHGIGGNAKSWLKCSKFLSNKFDSYFIDLPGRGESVRPLIEYTLDLNAKILDQFIESLNTKNFILVGNSYGGWLALYYSTKIKYPSFLVLEDSAGLNRPIGYSKSEEREAFIDSLVKIGNSKFVIENMIKNNTNDKFRISENELRNIVSPTIIIWGNNDKIIPLDFAFKFSKFIPCSKLFILENVGHVPHLEIPEKFCEILNVEIFKHDWKCLNND